MRGRSPWDCTVNASITGTNYTGGVVGGIYTAANSKTLTITSTKVSGGSVSGAAAVGGVIGYVQASWTVEITHTTDTMVAASVTGSGAAVGGVVGQIVSGCPVTIEGSTTANKETVTSTISGKSNSVGGIVGLISNATTLKNVSKKGSVTTNISGASSAWWVGGLIGKAEAAVTFCTDTACVPVDADKNGAAVYEAARTEYHLTIVELPDGYEEPEDFDVYIGPDDAEMTVQVTKK